MEETSGILSFALGGALLMLNIYFIVENANNSGINANLFAAAAIILPLGLIAFLLLELGLYYIPKSTRNQEQ